MKLEREKGFMLLLLQTNFSRIISLLLNLALTRRHCSTMAHVMLQLIKHFRGHRAVHLAGEGVDLSLSFVQSPCELAVLLVALMKLTLHPLQLQT